MESMRSSTYLPRNSMTASPTFSGIGMSRGPGLSSGELGSSSFGVGSSSRLGATGNVGSGVSNDLAHIELREEAINKTSILLLEDNKKQIGVLKSEIQNKEAMIRRLEDQNRTLKDTSSLHAAEKERIIADYRMANQELAKKETELRVKEMMLDNAQKDSSKQRSMLENSIREEQDRNISLQKSLVEKEQEISQLKGELNSKRQQLAVAEGTASTLQADRTSKDMLISALNTQINNKDAQIASLTKDKQMIPGLQFENKRLNDELNRYRMYEELYKQENIKNHDLETMLKDREATSKKDEERIGSLNNLISSLNNISEKQKQNVNQLQNEKNRLESELTRIKTTNANLEAELSNVKADNNNLKLRVDDMDEYIKGLDIQIMNLKKENQSLNNDSAHKENELMNKNRMIEDMAQSLGFDPSSTSSGININDIPRKIKGLVSDVDSLRQQLDYTQRDAASKGTELMKLKDEAGRKIEELTKNLNAANVDKDMLNSRINQLNNDISSNYVPKIEFDKTKAELASEQSKTRVLGSGLEKVRNELDMAKNEGESAKKTLSQLQREKELSDSKIAALQQREKNLEYQNSILIKDNNEKSSRVQRLEGETEDLKRSIDSIKGENDYLNSQNLQLSAKYDEASRMSSHLDSQVKDLQISLREKDMERMRMEQENKEKAVKRMSLLETRARSEEDLGIAINDATSATGGNNSMVSSRSSFFSPKLTRSICDEPTGIISPMKFLSQSKNMTEEELGSVIEEIDRSMRGY